MRNCTMNYRSLLFTSTIISFHVCKVQDPKPWWNCPYTEGAAAVNTFIHCQVYVTRTLALGREPELGHHLSPNRPSTARKKNLETRVQSLKLCGSHISSCVLPHVLKLECSSLTLFTSCSEALGLCF